MTRLIGSLGTLGSEVGEPHDLTSVLSGESCRILPIFKCNHARSAPVEMRFERVAVLAHGRMVLHAGAHAAISDHVAVLGI